MGGAGGWQKSGEGGSEAERKGSSVCLWCVCVGGGGCHALGGGGDVGASQSNAFDFISEV